MSPKISNMLIQILRIAIAAPTAYFIGDYLKWENFMLLLLYFGVYIVVSMIIEGIRMEVLKRRKPNDVKIEDESDF